ncbi:MAG: tetratricopeptide repeat protein [Magnetospirillum sp.]|nr:tetratricopeptide repeat protein [Magnetospirillum sp.]
MAMRALFEAGFEMAKNLHQQDRLYDAEAAYRQILKRDPDHAGALHYLGVIAMQAGKTLEGLDLIEQSLVIDPLCAEAHTNRGMLLMILERYADAEPALRRAMELGPNLKQAPPHLAALLTLTGRAKEAVPYWEQAVAANPNDADLHFELARAYASAENDPAMLREMDAALALNPTLFGALIGRSVALRRLGQPIAAIDPALAALQERPDSVEAGTELAAALLDCGQSEAAESAIRHIEALYPDDVTILTNLCGILQTLQRFDEAIEAGERAISLQPNCAPALQNLGAAYRRKGWTQRGIDMIEKAMEVGEPSAAAYNNLGACYRLLPDLDTADRLFAKALEMDKSNVGVLFNTALLAMCRGDIDTAWKYYEFGIHNGQRRPKFFVPIPPWLGDDPANYHIVVRREQGLGDEVLFASIVPDLIKRARKVTLEVAPKILSLARRSFPDAEVLDTAELAARGIEGFDRQCLIGSLGIHLRKSFDDFPAPHRAYVADPARAADFHGRLRALPGALKVGIVWRSSLVTDSRSILYLNVGELAPLAAIPDVHLINLQYDNKFDNVRGELAEAQSAGIRITHFDDLDTFDDIEGVAALCEACDVIVTIPSTVGHIAGGLGKPVLEICMIPIEQNWGKPRSPYWPSIEVVVPTKPFDKAEVVAMLAERLIGLAAEQGS